jgi:16S rRNA (uracil1498-N3)-methyltransferase
MHSFYLSQKINGRTAAIIDPVQIHHLKDVLRLGVDDEISLFDDAGNEYLCAISRLDKKQVLCVIKELKLAPPRTYRIAVACAIPKQSRMDDIIDKLTQLGVDTIIPLLTERVIIKLESNQESRLERWRKIALSASEQSHRNTLPCLSRIMDFEEVIAQAGEYDLKLIPTLAGDRKTIKEILTKSSPISILVLIGPEGDFTPQEIGEAFQSGFQPVSLGDSVLRVETAAIAIASYLRFSLMD